MWKSMIMAAPDGGRPTAAVGRPPSFNVVLRDRRLQALLADQALELDHRGGEMEDGVPLGAVGEGGAEALELHHAVVRELLDAQDLGMDLRDLSRHLQDR